MGFQKRWDVGEIQRQINACSAQVNSPYNDGFTSWACKQDLLIVKYQLDELLRSTPKFAPEEDFVKELEQKLVWKRLNENTN